MTDEMKPVRCGCGGEAKVDWTVINGAYMAGVVCTKCGMKTASVWRMDDLDGAKDEAITAWNLAMGATDNNVGDKFAKDINVPNKETVIIEPFTTDMNHVGYCECGYLVNAEWKYCPLCGARLIWGDYHE